MENFRLTDPMYVDFEPANVAEAILRFRRLQIHGLNPEKYPEAMIECCAKLPAGEAEKFESWLINPAGPAKGVPISVFERDNEAERARILAEHYNQDDEKMDPHNHEE